MKIRKLQFIVAAMAALSALSANAQSLNLSAVTEQLQFPRILRQPEDRGVWAGSNLTLTVTVENADSYQWMRNGGVLNGQTNATLTIEKMGVEDVGLYTCFAFKGDEAVPTRSANVNVYTTSFIGGGTIVVFGLPLSGGGGSQGSCPGPYAGYVNYLKPAPDWGWIPSAGTSFHSATDTNRSDTKILYMGRFGDYNCAQTSISLPHPTPSTKYRFSVYFTNNVPTNAYPILLEGFEP